MAVAYKVLGQAAPALNEVKTLYAVGGSGLTRMAVGSSLVICNRSETDSVRYTIEVSPDGTASKPEHRQFSNVTLGPNSSDVLTIGWALQAGAVIRVSSTVATVSFTLYGQELTP